MNAADISALARHLFEAKGAKAIAEAARRQASFEAAGDKAHADEWRQVKAVLSQMQGPRES